MWCGHFLILGWNKLDRCNIESRNQTVFWVSKPLSLGAWYEYRSWILKPISFSNEMLSPIFTLFRQEYEFEGPLEASYWPVREWHHIVYASSQQNSTKRWGKRQSNFRGKNISIPLILKSKRHRPNGRCSLTSSRLFESQKPLFISQRPQCVMR